ncbi:hypothetical protein E2C01_053693 [Portunus trituberculatus]|uniref:Uncharacterized protein n=1 Tax=Portunus trituberculatus TaxID=210409 RepID=A0A5B7GPX5_PORTR|nr:hypothetical protein [Portunus trituberculatus]
MRDREPNPDWSGRGRGGASFFHITLRRHNSAGKGEKSKRKKGGSGSGSGGIEAREGKKGEMTGSVIILLGYERRGEERKREEEDQEGKQRQGRKKSGRAEGKCHAGVQMWCRCMCRASLVPAGKNRLLSRPSALPLSPGRPKEHKEPRALISPLC